MSVPNARAIVGSGYIDDIIEVEGDQCMKGQRSLLCEARMKVKAVGIEEVAYTGRKSRGGAERLVGSTVQCSGVHRWTVERV